MLILSRKANEKIMIGDDISVTIIEIRGDQIRVGVVAIIQYTINKRTI